MKPTTEQIRWTGEAELSVEVTGDGEAGKQGSHTSSSAWRMSVVNTLFFKITFATACCWIPCLDLTASSLVCGLAPPCFPTEVEYSVYPFSPLISSEIHFDSVYPSQVFPISTFTVSEDIYTNTHTYIYMYTHTHKILFHYAVRKWVIMHFQECRVLKKPQTFVYDST